MTKRQILRTIYHDSILAWPKWAWTGRKSQSDTHDPSLGRHSRQRFVNFDPLLARLLIPLQRRLVIPLYCRVALVIDLPKPALRQSMAGLARIQKRLERTRVIALLFQCQPIPIAPGSLLRRSYRLLCGWLGGCNRG